MTYLYGYLIIGGFYLMVMALYELFKEDDVAPEATQMLDNISRQLNYNQSWWDKLVKRVIAPLIASVVIVVAWPAVIAWFIKDRFWETESLDDDDYEDDVFEIASEHLQERVAIEEIETREIVEDPLGAVPALPFGHLNTGWEKLKQQIQPQDEIWSFSAPWDGWPHSTRREGYAMMRKQEVSAWFLSAIQLLDDA